MIEQLLGPAGFGGGLVVSKLIDYIAPFELSPQGKLFKEQKKLQLEIDVICKFLPNYFQKNCNKQISAITCSIFLFVSLVAC